jgi:tripartite-type tricarboxylate transporter receptor subunit TctC
MITLRASYGDEQRDLDTSHAVKLMRFIIPGPPGASFDRYGRLVARHIGRFLPGHPMVIAQNMPGASGRVALHYLCERAPQDGTAFGLMLKQTAMFQAIGENVPCDVTKLHYIGSPARIPESFVVWWKSRTRSVYDLLPGETVRVGATTNTGASFIMPKLLNSFLGTKYKFVTGYTGGPQLNLAMEKEEIDARSSESWGEWMATKPDWVEGGMIRPILQMGFKRHPKLLGIPLLTEVVKNGAAGIATLSSDLSRPIIAPPGVPMVRVIELRMAFEAMMCDPMFKMDADRIKAELEFISGDELGATTRRIVNALPSDLMQLKAALAKE